MSVEEEKSVDVMEVPEEGEIVELPIAARRAEIVGSVRDHRVTIIVAETGSGKSSQVIRWALAVDLLSLKLSPRSTD